MGKHTHTICKLCFKMAECTQNLNTTHSKCLQHTELSQLLFSTNDFHTWRKHISVSDLHPELKVTPGDVLTQKETLLANFQHTQNKLQALELRPRLHHTPSAFRDGKMRGRVFPLYVSQH